MGNTSQTFVVKIVNDDVLELPESFQAQFTLVSGAGVQIGQNDLATININDDDGRKSHVKCSHMLTLVT